MGDRRTWCGSGVVVVGVGAAILTGTGIAAADSGADRNTGGTESVKTSDSSSAAKSATSSTETGAAKRRAASAVAAARTSKLKVVSTPPPSMAADDATATKPKSADKAPRRHLPAVVTRIVSAVDVEVNKVATNPVHPRYREWKTTPAIAPTVTADGTASPVSPVSPAGPSPRRAAATTEAAPTPAQPAKVMRRVSAIRSVSTPVAEPAPASRPLATLVLNLLSGVGAIRRPQAVAAFPALAAWSTPGAAGAPYASSAGGIPPQTTVLSVPSSNTVTGVKVGHSDLEIPLGPQGYTVAADWYFPTQADGSVKANGVIWLQHGFLADKSWYSGLATQVARQTNSVVVAPNISSFAPPLCADCSLNSVPLQQAVATMFLGDRDALNTSATKAGLQDTLPERFILTGHSAGGGLATAVGGYYTGAVAPADNDLLGVVMFDGVSSNGSFAPALASLDTLNIPVLQIAAPPQPWNAYGQTTNELVALRSGEFVGAVLANGSHVDSLIDAVPIIDSISQLIIKPSPPGNTAAVYTLATGWINDMYAGKGATDPQYGIYGEPDQLITMGQTAAVVLGPAPVVDPNSYLGTWYEVGSVKQFFSIGLVNTKAVYTLNPDGSIRIENSGNYFFDKGPESSIVGSAVPVDPANNKLNVSFLGPASPTPPGNYWIVDLAPDYSWAIVTDSTGTSGFLLSRTPTVSDEFYQELLDRASVKGVNGTITPTAQPAAGLAAIAV
jgi:lipocalin